MFFEKNQKPAVEASGLTSQERQRLEALEVYVVNLDSALIELCYALKAHIERIDQNTRALDNNFQRLASMTIRPPKDLLNGPDEIN